jgi:hypothetical protein
MLPYNSNMKRMSDPAHSPDLSPCDFFLFGALNDKLINKQYARPKELFAEVQAVKKVPGPRPISISTQ